MPVPMSYQVLARKWRPQTFDEVVGQESVTRTIQRALSTGRLAHAFLFTGSRGIGKTTLARILAKALSCETGITGSPCGTCRACVEITEGKSVDVIEIDGASNTGVDDVRELREVARFMPQSLRFKIFIIDEVHMLSTGAFNALLKTLEEPPAHVKFIFATTEVHKIPVTILSRCQRYDFKRIPTDVIVGRLEHVLAAEGIRVDPQGLQLIARAAEGGMRDALSLTDQVLSFAGGDASAEDVVQALGLIDRRSVVRATWAALDRDAKTALSVIEEAFAAGHDLKQLADGLATELRNLAIARAAGSLQGFADLAPEDIAEVDARAKSAEGRDLQRLFHMALEGVDQVAKSESPRLALELMVLRMCDRPALGDAMAISDAITRLDALAKGRPVPPPRVAGPAVAIAREALATPQGSASVAAVDEAPETERRPSLSRVAAREPVAPMSSPAMAVEDDTLDALERDPPEERAPDLKALAQKHAKAAPAPAAPPEEDDDEGEAFDPALGYVLDDIDDRWLAFVRQVAAARQRLGGVLSNGRFVAATRQGEAILVEVAFDKALHRDDAAQSASDPAVIAALSAFGEGAALVVTEPREGLGPSIAEAQHRAAEKAQAALEAHAKSHPVVQKALSLFGGEVRQVKA